MKLILVSDNHGALPPLKEIHQRHHHETDLFLHCGDSQMMAAQVEALNYISVEGNCDFGDVFPEERVVSLPNGMKAFMAHGHLLDVKMNSSVLVDRAATSQAQLAFYGHTHHIHVEMIRGILVVNPGSVTYPRNTREKTYARLDFQDGRTLVEILEVLTGTRLFHYLFDGEGNLLESVPLPKGESLGLKDLFASLFKR